MSEWLGDGLQNRSRGFESRSRLKEDETTKGYKVATATQIVFIILHLLLAWAGFAQIGKGEGVPNRYRIMANSALSYGIFTIAFMLWWDTPDMISLIAKIAAIAIMWLPWIIDLADIHRPTENVTLKAATIAALICAARIGLVLGFWTLY